MGPYGNGTLCSITKIKIPHILFIFSLNAIMECVPLCIFFYNYQYGILDWTTISCDMRNK